MFVRKILPSEIASYGSHLKRLSAHDRHMRFGTELSNTAIDTYVNKIDLSRDVIKVVHDDNLNVIAAVHISRLLTEDIAEIGLSVENDHRGKGIGRALFKSAVQHMQSIGIKKAYTMCLRNNSPMMHIAAHEGMEMISHGGETEAYLPITPSIFSHWDEVTSEQCAWCDFIRKWAFKQWSSIMSLT